MLPFKAKLGPYIDLAGLDWIGPLEKTTIANSWSDILNILRKDHGDKTRVIVIPDATMQYFPNTGKG